jgi:RHS repeat-associated protein
MGWAANPTRKQESFFTLPIIQMGHRVYLPTLGRFLQVDPIEGGTLNPYVYAHDPVNMDDYSGQGIFGGIFSLRCLLCGTPSKGVASMANVVLKSVTAPKKATIRYKDYLSGTGKTIITKIADWAWKNYKIQDFGVDPNIYKGRDGTVSINKDLSNQGPIDLSGKLIIGRVANINLTGNLVVNGNNWTFKGGFTASPDYYDFNSDKTRGSAANFSTDIGHIFGQFVWVGSMGAINPQGYEIQFEGMIPIEQSGSF